LHPQTSAEAKNAFFQIQPESKLFPIHCAVPVMTVKHAFTISVLDQSSVISVAADR